MITCCECNGTGYAYYNENRGMITQEEYNQYPPEKRDREPCECCEGSGEITYNNEPDNYDYDE
jgi:RecJ-like exonuclease